MVNNMETRDKEKVNNQKEADILIRQLLSIGESMYQCGGEISRIEDTLHRLGKVYGAEHVSVYAITSSIVLTAEFSDGYSVTQIRRITRRGSIDCSKMEKLNQLCRDCERDIISVSELQKKVIAIINEHPKKSLIYIGQFIAAISFTFFFGGNVFDSLIAAVGVLAICLLQNFIKKYFSAEFFFNIVVSFITGAIVTLLSLIIPNLHVNQILIGDIMVLIPGIAITNSIRYIFSGDIVSSLEKLVDSLIQAFGIAIGFMLSLLLIKTNLVNNVPLSEPLKSIVQIISAGFGTIGFCMAFNMKKKHIIIPTIGGVICWLSYLLLINNTNMIFLSTLLSAAIIAIYGNIFARIIKVPTTILYIPACVPLIPGGNLYFMALAMISSDWEQFMSNLVLLTLYTIGISLGFALIGEAEKIIRKIPHQHSGK